MKSECCHHPDCCHQNNSRGIDFSMHLVMAHMCEPAQGTWTGWLVLQVTGSRWPLSHLQKPCSLTHLPPLFSFSYPLSQLCKNKFMRPPPLAYTLVFMSWSFLMYSPSLTSSHLCWHLWNRPSWPSLCTYVNRCLTIHQGIYSYMDYWIQV